MGRRRGRDWWRRRRWYLRRFLDASSHLYKKVCPSVHLCVPIHPLPIRKNRQKQRFQPSYCPPGLVLRIFHISPLTSTGRGATKSQHKLIFKQRCLVAELATKRRGECIMGQNQAVLNHLTVHFPKSSGVIERMNEWGLCKVTSKQTRCSTIDSFRLDSKLFWTTMGWKGERAQVSGVCLFT